MKPAHWLLTNTCHGKILCTWVFGSSFSLDIIVFGIYLGKCQGPSVLQIYSLGVSQSRGCLSNHSLFIFRGPRVQMFCLISTFHDWIMGGYAQSIAMYIWQTWMVLFTELLVLFPHDRDRTWSEMRHNPLQNRTKPLKVLVAETAPIEFRADAFEQLVLPAPTKEIIKHLWRRRFTWNLYRMCFFFSVYC